MIFISELQAYWLHINYYGFLLIPFIILFNFLLIYLNFKYIIILKQTLIFSIYISLSYIIYYFYYLLNICLLKYNRYTSVDELRFDWSGNHNILDININWIYGLLLSIFIFIFFIILYNNNKNLDWQEIIIILINFMLINCIYSITNIWVFIIIFEVFSLMVYLFLIQNKYNNNWNNTQYYFISFLISIIFIISLLYCIFLKGFLSFSYLESSLWYNGILTKNSISYIVLGIPIIWLLIKLGSFPFHAWLYNVYKKFNNITLLYFLSIYKTSLLIILSFFIVTQTYFITQNNHILFMVIGFSIGTTFIGSLLLNNQTNIKNFIISNSFIHLGTILAGFSINIFNKNKFDYIALDILILYIFFYILIILMLFFIIFEIIKNKENKYIKINSLIKKQNVLSVILIIWILSSFPPFILFFIKFYMLYYMFKSGLIFFGFFFFIINSTLLIWGYIRIFNYLLINYTI